MSRACDDAMAEDLLIEEVEKRLEAVIGMKRGIGSQWEWSPEVGRMLAREAIRLMRWARFEMGVYLPDVETETVVTQVKAPMSIPPDDWKP